MNQINNQTWFHIIQGVVTIIVFAIYMWFKSKNKQPHVKPPTGVKAFLPADFTDVIALLLLAPRLVEHYLSIVKTISGGG